MNRGEHCIFSDQARRATTKKFAYHYYIYNSFKRSKYISIATRWRITKKYTEMLFFYNLTTARNCCRASGRYHFVLARAGLARMPFNFLSGCGLLSGISRYGK